MSTGPTALRQRTPATKQRIGPESERPLRRDVVGPDGEPDDVRFVLPQGWTELERGPPIGSPRHLEDPSCALDTPDPKPSAESSSAKILDKPGNRLPERVPLFRRQRSEVALELLGESEGQHRPLLVEGGQELGARLERLDATGSDVFSLLGSLLALCGKRKPPREL